MTNDQKILAGLAILVPNGNGKAITTDFGGAICFCSAAKLSNREEALLSEYGWNKLGKDWYAPSE